MNEHNNDVGNVSEDSIDEGIYEGISDDEDDDDAAMEDSHHQNPHMNAMAHDHNHTHPSQSMMDQQHAAQAHIQAQAQAQAAHHGTGISGHGLPHGQHGQHSHSHDPSHAQPHGHPMPPQAEPINHMDMSQQQQQQPPPQGHLQAAAPANPNAAANPAVPTDVTGPADNQQNSSSSTTSLDVDNEPNLEGYERTDRIGQGAYGIVYRGVQRSTGVTVAIKRIPFADAAPEGGVPCNVIREISLLRELDHPNVVRLLDVNQARPGELYLVFEYVAHDLKTFLDKSQNTTDASGRQGLAPHLVRSFMRQILEGVGYCHTYRILHRDLKPHNVSFSSHNARRVQFNTTCICSLMINFLISIAVLSFMDIAPN
jgi:hypothetical protein